MDRDPLIPAPILTHLEGARDDREAAEAIIAGKNAPSRLSLNPRSPLYDPVWIERLRGVFLNGVPQTDVVSFDVDRGEVEILLRDVRGKELHEYVGPAWDPRTDSWPLGRLAYKTEVRSGTSRCPCGCGRRSHVAVQYALPVKRS